MGRTSREDFPLFWKTLFTEKDNAGFWTSITKRNVLPIKWLSSLKHFELFIEGLLKSLRRNERGVEERCKREKNLEGDAVCVSSKNTESQRENLWNAQGNSLTSFCNLWQHHKKTFPKQWKQTFRALMRDAKAKATPHKWHQRIILSTSASSKQTSSLEITKNVAYTLSLSRIFCSTCFYGRLDQHKREIYFLHRKKNAFERMSRVMYHHIIFKAKLYCNLNRMNMNRISFLNFRTSIFYTSSRSLTSFLLKEYFDQGV